MKEWLFNSIKQYLPTTIAELNEDGTEKKEKIKPRELFNNQMKKSDSLSIVVSQINGFLDTYNDPKKYRNGLPQLPNDKFINNQYIVDTLINRKKIKPEDLKGKSNKRNSKVKKAMDILLSRELVPTLKKSNDDLNNIVENIKNAFSNTLPVLSPILKNYPYNELKLRTQDKNLKSKIEQYEEQIVALDDNSETYDKDRKQIEDNIQEAYWESYKKNLETANPEIGELLQELWNNDFDYQIIGEEKLKPFLQFAVNSKYEELKTNGLLEKIFKEANNDTKFKQFLNDLVSKEEISLG
ncbi:MAG: hypothetical protein LBH96_02425 [Candidatus Peribacteria bacterium]|nr:hypothetical protein [Candidatus Peribacteria bacterium]